MSTACWTAIWIVSCTLSWSISTPARCPATEKRICLIAASELYRSAQLILPGELVAFPTETVYGLGANALDPAAVEKIYVAKGRPADRPLIVHVDSIQMARGLVREWRERAERLARVFWPGPL